MSLFGWQSAPEAAISSAIERSARSSNRLPRPFAGVLLNDNVLILRAPKTQRARKTNACEPKEFHFACHHLRAGAGITA